MFTIENDFLKNIFFALSKQKIFDKAVIYQYNLNICEELILLEKNVLNLNQEQHTLFIENRFIVFHFCMHLNRSKNHFCHSENMIFKRINSFVRRIKSLTSQFVLQPLEQKVRAVRRFLG